MKYCPHCGQLIKSDALVCPYCGFQQSRVSNDRPAENDQIDPNQPDRVAKYDQGPDQNDSEPEQVKYSRAKLTGLDYAMLILSVLNTATLFFLGFQGLIRPFYINNIGTFVTVILSLFSIIVLCLEMHENRKNRLPNLAAWLDMAGSVSVFILIFAFNQRFLLISMAILLLALFLFDRELKKTY